MLSHLMEISQLIGSNTSKRQIHILNDHEKIVLFHENILNREHYHKQGILPLRNQYVHKEWNYCKIKRFLLDSSHVPSLRMI